MRSYQLVFIVKSKLTEPERKKLLGEVKGWIHDVKITSENDWGSKALKYPIKKELTGHYFDFILETDKTIPADLEEKLMQEDTVLRHLLIRTK
ncbi:MAG TPA: 30S ribosomal protein S6 [Patescibacteria group bacterium]|nr:30S ribosomal protein S6 [Patescibacteria group bacterium]